MFQILLFQVAVQSWLSLIYFGRDVVIPGVENNYITNQILKSQSCNMMMKFTNIKESNI